MTGGANRLKLALALPANPNGEGGERNAHIHFCSIDCDLRSGMVFYRNRFKECDMVCRKEKIRGSDLSRTEVVHPRSTHKT